MFIGQIDFCQRKLVSILVFVELALDARRGSILSDKDIGFNPCFRGTCS